ncbi:type IX secretion system sortase PorU [Hymenobacter sp. HMF4947]|uniref:Type IX secretion system sortase PorU n=1 Tax=Hymenobacter ginkgonis TaxID=2682976 RepID=A0A7K1TFE9_9BACT|nr:type IX secretion system sortase PorU [Hymenobacter ginkgonis]MVN76871.1 type IX secretion system sortase PorU [Hymenobacter ginkgonis]
MRNFFPTLFLLATLVAGWRHSAQAQTSPGETVVPVTLSWTTYAALRGPNPDEPRRVPTFRGATHGPDEVLGTYTLRVLGTIATGALRDGVYEPFPAADAKLLGAATLPATPPVRLRFGTEARRAYSYVLVQPVRRNPQTGQAERLVSFSYAYQTGGVAPTARGANLSSTNSLLSTNAGRPHLQNSILRSGDWYKIGVPASGVYKLDRATLQSLGLPVSTLDPRKIQLYGNATGLLPQANATPRPDDLAENNIYFSGNNDAVFDAGEYFLFYAKGPHTWRASQPASAPLFGQGGLSGFLGEGGRFKHINNIYSDTAYYFVTVSGGNGRRIPAAAAPTVAPSGPAITTFLDRRFYEHDLVNVLHSGRRWLGESFSGSTAKNFKFSGDGNQPLADLVTGDTLRLTSAVATTALQASSFSVALNGTTLGTQLLSGIPNGSFTTVATNDFRTFTSLIPANFGTDPEVTFTFASGDPIGTGYLDYLELVVKRQLRLSGAFLEFNSLNYKRGAGTAGTFTLANASGAQVWEVTNPRRPQAQTLDASGNFVAYTDSLREFVAVQPTGNFVAPRLFGKIANQNLHAINSDGKTDLVIVTYPPFREQAEKLAQHRRDYNGLNVAVVTTKQIYNEYSSGGQDVTAIRDLMKQVYDRNPDPVNHRNYLLLFGDASYDYKSSAFNDASQEPAWWANRAPFKTTSRFDEANQNFVPTYESRESFLPVSGSRANVEGENSYSSEDYYGLLDDNEGEWLESSGVVFESVDIGIGRLPVRTALGQRADASQAAQVVAKIIAYDEPASFGKWRNRIALTADDGDGSAYATESETIFAANIKAAEPAYNLRKDYLDLFPQVSLAAGQRSPAAMAAIDESLEQGSLLIGYTGHGGPSALADEQIITTASLLNLQNKNRLTFLVTGTCDLSTYDNPDFTSAGEQVLTNNAEGGAVGLFTTTRVVLSFFNTEVVNSFYSQVLSRNSTGTLPFLGLAASTAKNNSLGGDLNNRNYTLLADPTTRLAYPRQRVVLDSINGRHVQSIATSLDTLQALGQVRLSGHVENGGVLNTAFGGTADITIFDKPVTVMTLGDQGSPPVPVETQENVIYGGQASVRAGRFSVKFIVPKDIAYNAGLGKISLYAADLANRVDAQGYQQVVVGGASRTASTDTTPPTVQLFMTDETFISGGSTDLSPLFIAHLSDKSGINTSSAGIGHDITATLDNDPTKLVIVNDSYTSDVDNFMSGRVRYPYKSLTPGPHTIKLKAWDTYNNSAEGTVDFIAAQSEQLALDHVLNYPNPFSNITTFHFDQNHAGEDLDVQVQIFTVAGRLVKTLRTTVPASTAHVPRTTQDPTLTWNGRDDYDDQLARGVYVYRVSIRLASGGQTATKFEKLVLLN